MRSRRVNSTRSVGVLRVPRFTLSPTPLPYGIICWANLAFRLIRASRARPHCEAARLGTLISPLQVDGQRYRVQSARCTRRSRRCIVALPDQEPAGTYRRRGPAATGSTAIIFNSNLAKLHEGTRANASLGHSIALTAILRCEILELPMSEPAQVFERRQGRVSAHEKRPSTKSRRGVVRQRSRPETEICDGEVSWRRPLFSLHGRIALLNTATDRRSAIFRPG
jgi:hypothetical protein